MTVFKNFKWLDKYGDFDSAPWMRWFDKNYCDKCEAVVIQSLNGCNGYAWCELHNKCKFFQDMNDIPDSKQTIKMWLESEA